MIAINLLPQEMRKPEGTPLPRLLTVLGGALVLSIGGVFAFQYYIVTLPAVRNSIATSQTEREAAQKVADEVDKLDASIRKVNQKVNALNNLLNSQLRWARLLDRFSRAWPEQCGVRTFRIQPEGAAVPNPTAGKKFRLSLTGYTTGESDQECQRKVTEITANLMREFEVAAQKAAGAAPEEAPKADAGYSKFTGLKFDEPVLQRYVPKPEGIGEVTGLKGAAKAQHKMPSRGLEFDMYMDFHMKPPLQQE